MQSNGHHKGIGFGDPDDFRRVRDVFATANYSESGIIDFLGCEGLSTPIAVQVPPFVLQGNKGTTLETLLRLFFLGMATEVTATRRALQPMALEQWVEAGMVEVAKESVVPSIRIVPYQGLLLACDLSPRSKHTKPADIVMGMTGSTLALGRFTIRRPTQLTLDLGTGCGVQSFLAAAHSEWIVAVDRNPRACNFAAFNARLNGFTNIDFFEGDLYEPVQGQQFDLVVMNPPFVISPEFRTHYQNSGMTGDQFCQKIVRQAPEFLREGAFCQIFCHWAHVEGLKWQERLARWFEGTGCDVWVMRTETRSPTAYTYFWNQEKTSHPEFPQIYNNWMAYYKRERIERISSGLITMRRSSGRPNWFRVGDAPEKVWGPLGDDITRVFELFDFLMDTREDRTLLNERLQVSPDVRYEPQYKPSAQGWRLRNGQLRRTQGFCYTCSVDPQTANLVLGCNGQLRVGDLLSGLAAQRKVTLESIAPTCLANIRRLIGRGFLLPVRPENPQNEEVSLTTAPSPEVPGTKKSPSPRPPSPEAPRTKKSPSPRPPSPEAPRTKKPASSPSPKRQRRPAHQRQGD